MTRCRLSLSGASKRLGFLETFGRGAELTGCTDLTPLYRQLLLLLAHIMLLNMTAPMNMPPTKPNTLTTIAATPKGSRLLAPIAPKAMPRIPNSGGRKKNAITPQIRPDALNPLPGLSFATDECWAEFNVPGP